jgi:hypothetical protein
MLPCAMILTKIKKILDLGHRGNVYSPPMEGHAHRLRDRAGRSICAIHSPKNLTYRANRTQLVCAAFAGQLQRGVTTGPKMQLGRFFKRVGLFSAISSMGLAAGCGGERVAAPGTTDGKVVKDDQRSLHKELKEEKAARAKEGRVDRAAMKRARQ